MVIHKQLTDSCTFGNAVEERPEVTVLGHQSIYARRNDFVTYPLVVVLSVNA